MRRIISRALWQIEKLSAGFPSLGRWPPLMAIFMRESVSAVGAVGVFQQSLAEGVSMNSQSFGGFGKIVVVAAHNFKDETLFELLHGFIEENAVSDHLVNQQFKFGFHRLPSVGNACRDRQSRPAGQHSGRTTDIISAVTANLPNPRMIMLQTANRGR
jgi:hypothetical protein